MPVSFSYSLTAASVLGSVLGDAGFPSGAAQLICDVSNFSQADYLELIARLLPEEYLRPLIDNPDAGYEIFEALAAVAERVSMAAERVECGLVSLYAGGPTYSTVDVQFYRDTTGAGAVTVLAGTLVYTSKGGLYFETTEDAVFAGGDLTATAAARAIAPGYEYNVPGERTTAAGEVLPGEIDTVATMLQSPAFSDPTVFVRQIYDADGGAPDWLALHGSNRGLVQEVGEDSDAFRLRIRSLPDTVTPAALRRIAARTLGTIAWEFLETWRVDYVTCWDAPSENVGTPTYQVVPPINPLFDTDLFCFDNPRDASVYEGRLLGRDDYAAAMIFVIDTNITLDDYGFAFDDPTTLGTGFTTRGTPAYDLSGSVVSNAALDGTDTLKESAISAFYAEAQRAKAAGYVLIIDNYHTW